MAKKYYQSLCLHFQCETPYFQLQMVMEKLILNICRLANSLKCAAVSKSFKFNLLLLFKLNDNFLPFIVYVNCSCCAKFYVFRSVPFNIQVALHAAVSLNLSLLAHLFHRTRHPFPFISRLYKIDTVGGNSASKLVSFLCAAF